jgi:hypothetical protein
MATTAPSKRTRKGTPSEQLYNWDDVEADKISSALALQQYLQQLLRMAIYQASNLLR